MAGKKDYYDTLGVSKSATKDEIKKAFKRLAKKYHPDMNKEAGAAEKYKEAQEAYEVLSDDQKRAQYNQFGHAAFDRATGTEYGSGGFTSTNFDFGDIFGDIFGNSGFGDFFGTGSQRNPNAPQRGADLQITISISFEDAAFGVNKKIKISRKETCPKCHGQGAENPSDIETCPTCHGQGRVRVAKDTPFGRVMSEGICPECHGEGKILKHKCSQCHGAGLIDVERTIDVKIPAGIDDGQTVRLGAQGNAGHKGGPSGDLYVNVHVKKHELFTREGKNIYCVMPITYTQAALGADIEVPTLSGKVVLHVPSGTQTDTDFRLRGKGIAALNGGIHGDQYVKVKVLVPKKLSKKQRELLEELSENLSIDDHESSFFEKVKNLFN